MPIAYQPSRTPVDVSVGWDRGIDTSQFSAIASLLAQGRAQADKLARERETQAAVRQLFGGLGGIAEGGISPDELGRFMGDAAALGAGAEASSALSRLDAQDKLAEQQAREGRIGDFLSQVVAQMPEKRREVRYSGADFDPIGQLLRDQPEVARGALAKQYGDETAGLVEQALLQEKTGYVYDPGWVRQVYSAAVSQGLSPAEAKTALNQLFGDDAFESEEALRRGKAQEYRLAYQAMTRQGGTVVNVGGGLGGGAIEPAMSDELPVRTFFKDKLGVDVVSALSAVSPQAASRWRVYSPGFEQRVQPVLRGGKLVAQRVPAEGSPDAQLLEDLNAALSRIPSASAVGDVLTRGGTSQTRSQIERTQGAVGGATSTSAEGGVPSPAAPFTEHMATPEFIKYLDSIRKP